MSKKFYNNSGHAGMMHGRARSTFSVSSADYCLNLPVASASPAVSSVTLTPGRIRNIDQDMENLRASRQDNPFIQQVLASQESIVDSLSAEEESDHTNLMSKDVPSEIEDIDPMSLPEIHEHMIRSPPPVNWPKSPQFRAFDFGQDEETLSIELNSKDGRGVEMRQKQSWERNDTSPLRSFCVRSHHFPQDRFGLLTPGTHRPASEDSVHLMAED